MGCGGVGRHYPISLSLSGRTVIIIGGGKIAERKVNSLLDTGAKIEVVSPNLTQELQKWVKENRITWKNKTFTPEDIQQALLVIAATDQDEINQQVKRSARRDQLVCLVDDPLQSDFILPSILRRGRLTISISTGGASPILAKKIRHQLEQTFDEKYEEYLEFLAAARTLILETVKDPIKKRELLTAIVEPSYLESDHREETFQQLLNKVLNEK
jgi:precorrin-2 dehydrogenase / sirohydrochlorin ferrochelatase